MHTLLDSLNLPRGIVDFANMEKNADRFRFARFPRMDRIGTASSPAAAEKAAPMTQEQKKSAMLRSRLSGKFLYCIPGLVFTITAAAMDNIVKTAFDLHQLIRDRTNPLKKKIKSCKYAPRTPGHWLQLYPLF